MKRYLTALVIQKVLNNTMMLNHFTPTTHLSKEVKGPNILHTADMIIKWDHFSIKVVAVYNKV